MKEITLRHNGRRDGETKQVEETDLHCLSCGSKTVLVEIGDGDVYDGPEHFCTSCNHSFFGYVQYTFKSIETK
jgi:transposase-like protein